MDTKSEIQPELSSKILKTDEQVNAKANDIFKLIGNENRISKTKHYMGIAYLLQSYKGGTYYFQIDPKSSPNSNPESISSSNKRGSCIINEDRRLVSVGWNTILLKNSETKFENSEVLSAILNSNSVFYKNNKLFSTHFPDNKDAQAIKQGGITELFYLNNCSKCNKSHLEWSKNACEKCKGAISLLILSNVTIKKYSLDKASVKIDLTECSEENPKDAFALPNEETAKTKLSNMKDANLWMYIAAWTAACSQDKDTKVGACILDKNGKFLSTGYNGFPNDRIKEYFEPLWDDKQNPIENKHTVVCHAELNAIINSKANNKDLNDATIFVTLFPCEHCARLIITSGIKTVVYLSDHKFEKKEFKNSRLLLQEYSKNEPNFVLAKFKLDETNSEFTLNFEEENKPKTSS